MSNPASVPSYVACNGTDNRTRGLFVAAVHGCISTAAHEQALLRAAALPTAAAATKKAATQPLHRSGRPPG
jgi:hypothetical protein